MFEQVKWQENGKLKLLIIVGTRPEIIRLAAVITKCRRYFDVILAHTGQNYDYNLNGVFFKDLKLADPEVYLDAVGSNLGETCGNIIAKSYTLMAEIKPDAVLVLGDTNSCLSVIGAKRLHIPIFHMEAGNRCKDECLPEETNRRIVDIISDVNMAYSEHARRYLADCGLPKERTYVTGSPMAEVLHNNLAEIEASDIHTRLGLEKGKYILLSAHREENIDTEKNFTSLFTAINKMAEKYDMPILYSCHPRSKKRLETSGFALDRRVIRHEPLGFHDYNCLQMNAFCVVSDSGTLPEESSFFTSIGKPFPAVCIRTSTERPEALDKACFILSGIDEKGLLQSVDTAVEMNKNGDYGIPVPDYNSAVGTFCYNIANDLPIMVNDPSVELEMLFIDDLVEEMFDALEGKEHHCEFDGVNAILTENGRYCVAPVTYKATLGYIVECLHKFHDQPKTLVIPEMPNGSFEKKLYSMYLSYLPKDKVSFPLKMNVDARGSFTELLKTEKCGQVSVNILKPGITKGQHWHNSKWEFFIVVSGHGLIEERKIGTDEVLRFEVSGEKIEAVHMLPGYTHNIINLSDTDDLVTVMWANEQFDPAHPDTFGEKV